ncbi:MAG: phosphoenolpyruvate--protein phosphotransferase [bacterium]|nr:phosphoenolpyruvate--protein phosphotransferase [bacterium]
MKQYKASTIVHKIAVGTIFFYDKQESSVKCKKIEDTEAEIMRFERAKEKAKSQLGTLYEKAKREVGETQAEIFAVHQIMLDDMDYCDAIYEIIRANKRNAEYAVAVTGDNFSKIFAEMEDEYLKARAIDVKDISERVIRILLGEANDQVELSEPVILLANELTPSETIQMDHSSLLGFVTRVGSSNSHTAILARSMNVPALFGLDIEREWDGKKAIINGYEGTLTIDPDEKTLLQAQKMLETEQKREQLLETLKGKKTETKTGKRINLYANIGKVSDTGSALINDAEGIGLFRSEFLYLGTDSFPTENDQFLSYKEVAETMGGKKVIIRTLDIGADKKVDYFHLDQEENPALGYRAIRICLEQKEIFKTQIRAILRASAYGNISIMFPMIISVQEVREAKAIVQECKEELREQGIEYKEIEVGIMIETPAAVMISDELAKECDFFSIGTNDLTQYTLAIDRQNPRLESIYDAHHPAIIRMIQMTIENGHKGGAWVGICGELGADLSLIKTFIEMGLDELSVSPSAILPIREIIRMLDE